MDNNQNSIQDLLDELFDLFEKGWVMPLSGGKTFVDTQEAKQILEEIREALPYEIEEAKKVLFEADQRINQARKEAEGIIKNAENMANQMVNETEVVRQAQAKANDLMMQGQNKFNEMRQASSFYVEDIMRRADESLSEIVAEVRQKRQEIKQSQQNGQM